MHPYKIILTAGFAMFSMFFGSGNLVFPLLIGTRTLSAYPYAIVGLVITAVLIPFVGLFGMMQFKGNRNAYFSLLGKHGALILTALMLGLIGPFGVLPRCITVAFGGMSALAPSLPFWTFSLCFCLATAALIWKRNRIVSIIGLVLTPIKLGSILFLIGAGIWAAGSIPFSMALPEESFLLGLVEGYQTMDLIAAFFFGCTIYEYVQMRFKENPAHSHKWSLLKTCLYASLVGAALLSIVYIGFVLLGAKYAPYLTATPPESLLAEIATLSLGMYALPIIAMTLVFSCLATATILSTLCIDFLKTDLCHNKIPRNLALLIILSITFGISLLGFQSIRIWMGSILQWIYPALLGYAIFQILRNTIGKKLLKNT
jgi:LIVCS family branched-chain amino acid:cation transporter